MGVRETKGKDEKMRTDRRKKVRDESNEGARNVPGEEVEQKKQRGGNR